MEVSAGSIAGMHIHRVNARALELSQYLRLDQTLMRNATATLREKLLSS